MELNKEIRKGIACDSVGHPHSIVGRAICLSVHPGKMLLFPFLRWFENKYDGKYKHAKLLFALDLLLLGVAIALAGVALFLWLNPFKAFEDNILFEATVAPREISTGASSTLVIQYRNNTSEALRHATLQLSFPDHFLLQKLSSEDRPIIDRQIDLGTIGVGDVGTVHLQGVMLGSVGETQTFKSDLSFVHGNDTDSPGLKTVEYGFTPTSSKLVLSLQLPEQLMAFQEVNGTIVYENTSEIDFPEIDIEPTWPEGFTSDTQRFRVPAVKAHAKGTIPFSGYLGDAKQEIVWRFDPSFVFNLERYQQDKLIHISTVVPAPLKLSHSIDKSSLQPGSTATIHIEYEEVGTMPVSSVTFGVESLSPFFPSVEVLSPTALKIIQPGERGSIDLNVRLRPSIKQSETTVFENLSVDTKAVAHYTFGDSPGQQVTSKDSVVQIPLTTPLTFESFARYTTASGDQIGRGPLPPTVLKPTSYWIFWNIDGTTNSLENISVSAVLPENVVFTGKQSSSQNGGVSYDATTRTLSWSADKLSPTFSPLSKIVGIAFELEITPTADQIGTSPVLLKRTTFTAVDAFTGALLTRSNPDITTFLPTDKLAQSKGQVK